MKKEAEARTSDWLRERTERKKEAGLHRELPTPLSSGFTDLRSNDHLGLSRDPELRARIVKGLTQESPFGSTGSRLISGNSRVVMELEREMADHYAAEGGLLFPSGYQANVGIITALGAYRDVTLLYDERVHASMRDGIRMAVARSFSFAHNDLEDLEKKVTKAEGPAFILSEALFSMDGDGPPLRSMLELAERYDAALILDEAHSNGVYGEGGAGSAVQERVEDRVFARIFPFGKAFAQQGSFVAGSEALREFLIDHARSFIYSTAPSFPVIGALRETLRYVPHCDEQRKALFEKAAFFRAEAEKAGLPLLPEAYGPIQGVILEGNEEVQRLEAELWNEGYAVKGIRKPTVPEGEERIRFMIHADTPEGTIADAIRTIASHL